MVFFDAVSSPVTVSISTYQEYDFYLSLYGQRVEVVFKVKM